MNDAVSFHSQTVDSFWELYRKLPIELRQKARKSYHLWRDNPFHRSLRFKCINNPENIWSARITKSHRALGILEGDTVIWFWIGNHDDYEKFFG